MKGLQSQQLQLLLLENFWSGMQLSVFRSATLLGTPEALCQLRKGRSPAPVGRKGIRLHKLPLGNKGFRRT